MIREHRNLVAWIALAGLLVFGTMCVPFFRGHVYVADDLGAFHLPIRDFYSRQLAGGQPWDWMPTLYCGFYLTGEGQLGGYHPLHLVLYRLLPLGAAFNLELLLNYPFLAVGAYLLLRRLIGRRDAAAFGALTFTFSSFTLLHFVHPNAVAVVAHLPWLLWAIDVACRAPSVRARRLAPCAIALLTGSQLLLGYPQYVWFSLLAEASYVGYCLYPSREWRRAAGVVAAIAVGGLIGAIQLLPTVDALAESNRPLVRSEFRNSGSLAPLNLVQLVDPYLFRSRVVGQNTHELGLYLGAVPLALCCWLVFKGRKALSEIPRNRRTALFFSTFAAVALLYALGQFGPIYWMQGGLPIVRTFRFPCRGIVLFQLAAAALTAIAWTCLVRMPRDRRFVPPTGDAIENARSEQLGPELTILSIVIAGISLVLWPQHCNSALLMAFGPMLVAVATMLVNACAQGRRWAPVALIVFGAADLAAYGLSYAVLRDTPDLNQYVGAQALPTGSVEGRVVADDCDGTGLRSGNQMLLAGYSRADGYAGLEPQSAVAAGDRGSLQAADVGWVRRNAQWQQVIAPDARFRMDDPHARLSVATDAPGHFVLRINSAATSRLVIAERFHAGWRASLGGKELPIIRAGSFMACEIPSGRHRLNMHFRPASLQLGRLLTLCGLGLTWSWAALAVVVSRRSARGN